jgi:SAM-dependent methyltransferase
MSPSRSVEAERIVSEFARREAEIPPDRYAATNPAVVFIRQAIERALIDELRRAGQLPLTDRRVLDVGCGSGQWLADLETWGASRANLSGVDLIPSRVDRCRERLPGADVRVSDAIDLPWPDGNFDVVLQSTMLSAILDPWTRARVAREMARVVRPGGVILSYDFYRNNPRNRNVRAVRRAELDPLFPEFRIRWRRVTLAPPLVRFLAPRSWTLAMVLETAKVLDTHALAALRPAGSQDTSAGPPAKRPSASA